MRKGLLQDGGFRGEEAAADLLRDEALPVSDSGAFTSGSTALKLWELSPTRRGQRLLKIDHGLLTHSEKPLLGTVEIGDQRHDRREREDEREERQ